MSCLGRLQLVIIRTVSQNLFSVCNVSVVLESKRLVVLE
jgi:hypothetical protein